jgi:hypothetical protein
MEEGERKGREMEIGKLMEEAGGNRGQVEAKEAAATQIGLLAVDDSTAGSKHRPQVCNGSQDWYRE